MERWNNTLRQHLARIVRKSLVFFKSDEFQRIALQLYIYEYNLAGITSMLITTRRPILLLFQQNTRP
ncbi:MAG: hypothetical protein ACXV8O_20235 [Methylobacter sp.]